MSEGCCLARAGAGDDEQGVVSEGHGVPLLDREPLQQGVALPWSFSGATARIQALLLVSHVPAPFVRTCGGA